MSLGFKSYCLVIRTLIENSNIQVKKKKLFMAFFTLPPILYAKLDLPTVFIIVPLHAGELKELYKSRGLSQRIKLEKLALPPILRNSLRFPCMPRAKSNDYENRG